MKIQLFFLFSMFFIMQPVFSLSYRFTNKTVNSKHNDFIIDFDAIDKELQILKLEEKKPKKSWWITKKIKHIGTKIMIKSLLGYIGLQEFCVNKWHNMSRRIRELLALCYAFKSNKNFNDPKKL